MGRGSQLGVKATGRSLRRGSIAARTILPYDAELGRRWARMSAGAQLRGRPRPQNDTLDRRLLRPARRATRDAQHKDFAPFVEHDVLVALPRRAELSRSSSGDGPNLLNKGTPAQLWTPVVTAWSQVGHKPSVTRARTGGIAWVVGSRCPGQKNMCSIGRHRSSPEEPESNSPSPTGVLEPAHALRPHLASEGEAAASRFAECSTEL
jgi:hypothetical protein